MEKLFLLQVELGNLASYMIYVLLYLNENIENFGCNIILSIRSEEKARKKFGDYIDKKYFKLYKGNILDNIEISDKIDYIIHAASIAQTQFFSTIPIEVMEPNFIGVNNLLKLAEKSNVESFLFFSTCSVYGNLQDKKEISENDYGILNPLDINSCYSESKRLGEALCRAYYLEKNIKTKIARISHTYGPSIDLENDKRVFSEFIKNILNKEKIVLKSDGSAVRSFCYISDVTEAFFKILINGKNGEVYNVANPFDNISILELAQRLSKEFLNNEVVEHKKGDDNYFENIYSNKVCYSINKIRNELNWEPKIHIEEGFRRTIDSFLC